MEKKKRKRQNYLLTSKKNKALHLLAPRPQLWSRLAAQTAVGDQVFHRPLYQVWLVAQRGLCQLEEHLQPLAHHDPRQLFLLRHVVLPPPRELAVWQRPAQAHARHCMSTSIIFLTWMQSAPVGTAHLGSNRDLRGHPGLWLVLRRFLPAAPRRTLALLLGHLPVRKKKRNST